MFAPFTHFTREEPPPPHSTTRNRRENVNDLQSTVRILCKYYATRPRFAFFCYKTTIVFDDDYNSCCFDSQRQIHARRVRILVQITKETEERPICEMSNGTCECV